jgi:hypothetical protein
LPEWIRNNPVIHLLLFALLSAAQNAAPDKCLISGTVVDSVTGAPLNKVETTAENDANRGTGQTPWEMSWPPAIVQGR